MHNEPESGRERLRQIARRAMIERGLEPDFPAGALAETARAAELPAHDADVADLRHLLWASIDNDDSRDLDQLSVAEPLEHGAVRVLIAIADVDSTVARGSAVDEHARLNTTSVYTPGAVFPMLPERFSTDLTSLNQGEDRLAIVVSLAVAASGEVTGSEVLRAMVRNRARLSYGEVAAWLDGRGPMPDAMRTAPGIDEQIRVQDRVASTMRGLRHRHGAMQFHASGTVPVFDGDSLADIIPDEGNRAKELVEDFMIAANSATAVFLESRGLPSIRRVLKAPARWPRIVALAGGIGETLPPEPDPVALQAMLVRCRQADPQGFADLSLSVIKLLGSGEYAVDRPGRSADGHFGLAARDYTHATAPNRRYPDLVTQRLLKAALGRASIPYGDAELDDLARHCTLQEDNAAKVERQVRKSAAALLLAGRLGDYFDGIVTGASPKGTWVRVAQPPAEGRVMTGTDGLDVGDHVRVRLVEVDVERGFIDFAIARRQAPGQPS
jgi:exoribonuclease-2